MAKHVGEDMDHVARGGFLMWWADRGYRLAAEAASFAPIIAATFGGARCDQGEPDTGRGHGVSSAMGRRAIDASVRPRKAREFCKKMCCLPPPFCSAPARRMAERRRARPGRCTRRWAWKKLPACMASIARLATEHRVRGSQIGASGERMDACPRRRMMTPVIPGTTRPSSCLPSPSRGWCRPTRHRAMSRICPPLLQT